ncbi:MAG: hypothetical protein ABW199_10780 [Caulobacterales bacterium]
MSYNTDIGISRTNGAAKMDTNTEVKESLTALRDDASKLGGAIKSAAREKIADQRGRLEDATHELSERAQTIFSRLEERVRNKPAAALGISLGAGLVLGMLMFRRR